MEKKDLDKRVRALTTLTKEDEIPYLAAGFFDSEHPLPVVCAFLFINMSLIRLLVAVSAFLEYFCDLI
jgi:hypothetical protein